MKYKTCVAITENNPKKLSKIVKNVLKKSEFVEIRFDFLKPKDIPISLELVKKQLVRCVCTLRPKNEGGKFVVSWHDFKKTPNLPSLNKKLKNMKKFSNHIKIVTMAKTVNDATRIMSLYNNTSGIKLIAFSMGEEGRFTRILCLHMGSQFTYVSLGTPIAPGQFSLDEIRKMS